jgi:hypothetical protein
LTAIAADHVDEADQPIPRPECRLETVGGWTQEPATQPGARTVILQLGINDVVWPDTPTAATYYRIEKTTLRHRIND